ncbi:MAG: hypothetical protein J0I19_16725 [Alphaproteobacteria bacterium]|nr:hypothetical protein [Alphaproteobacteria bacterium]
MAKPKPKVMCVAFTNDREEDLALALNSTGCVILAIFEDEQYDEFIAAFAAKIVSEMAN